MTGLASELSCPGGQEDGTVPASVGGVVAQRLGRNHHPKVTERQSSPGRSTLGGMIRSMVELGGRRHRRIGQVFGAICAAAVAGSVAFVVWHLSHGGFQAVDVAALVAVPIGVIGLVPGVAALRRPIEGNDAELAITRARTLARQVEKSEGKVLRQLLGADTQAINLAYHLHPAADRAAIAPPAGRTSTDGSAALPDIVAYYRSTRPRRLVVTGAAGAGKTVLALELMLALIKDRAEDDPVPVRIPIAQWDTSQPLEAMLVQHLTDAYDWPLALAIGLVDHGLVLPVLDGLDEMDPLRDDGTPDPDAPRATAALEVLNAYQDGRDAGPLILTCRTGHYDAFTPVTHLIDAARIAIAPVDAQAAVTYLRNRSRDGARWQPLLTHLAAQPTGPLATVLSTPWRLCLTATVYHRTGDPAELLTHPTADDIDQHLLARFVPAATDITPNAHRYQPDDIHHWLHQLTHHLNGTPTGALVTDIALQRLWPLAGPARVRNTDVFLSTLTVLLTLPLAWTTSSPGTAVLFITLTAVTLARRNTENRSSSNPTRLRNSSRTLTYGLMAGMGAGAVCGLVFGLAAGLGTGVAAGLVFGLAAGFGAGFSGEPTTVANPRVIIHHDIVYVLVAGLVAGCAVGLVIGLVYGVVFGLVCGLAAGLGASLADGSVVARRYCVFLLCSRGRLPFRLARFLDWAVTAGLLRYSGPAYQFRHREFQQWLTRHPTPDPYR